MKNNILTNWFTYLLPIVFSFVLVIFALPQPSQALICETDTIKNGEYCDSAFNKSWCGNSATTCQVEPTITPGVNGAIGSGLSCNSCEAVCPGAEVACIGDNISTATNSTATCQISEATANGGANFPDGDAELNDGKAQACGEVICRTDYITCGVDCRAPATGSCPIGTTLDQCTGECSVAPYILASPSTPQSAYIDISGGSTIGGNAIFNAFVSILNGDLGLGDGKAVRVDSATDTSLNIGNWLAGNFKLNILGNLSVTGSVLANSIYGATSVPAETIIIGDTGDTISIGGQIQIKEGGVLGAGKVLTSDATGLATWQTPVASGGSSLWSNDGPGGPAEIYYNGGYAGIGTNDPVRDLHIKANTTFAYLHITDDTTGETINDGFDIGTVSGEVRLFNRESTDLVFYTNASERVRILANGDVDIGSSTPSPSNLIVGGNIKTNTHVLSDAFYGTTGNSIVNLLGSDVGDAQNIWLGDANDDIQVQGQICFGTDNSDCSSTWAGLGGSFWTANGNNIVNSNVGNVNIGGIDILNAYRLYVNGATRLNGNTIINGNIDADGDFRMFNDSIDLRRDITVVPGTKEDGTSLYIHAGDGDYAGGPDRPGGDLYLYGGESDGGPPIPAMNGDVLLAYTGNSARGNVAIGKNSPTEKLDVAGNIKTSTHVLSDAFYGTTGNSTINVLGSGIGDAQNIWLGDANDDIQVQGQICFGTNNTDCSSTWAGLGGSFWTAIGDNIINSNIGNVLVGGDIIMDHDEVDYRRDITVGTKSKRNGTDLYVHAGDGEYGGGTSDSDGGDLYLFGGIGDRPANTVDGNVLLAHNGLAVQGNVGIGTISPGSLLDVAGNMKSLSATIGLVSIGSGSDYMLNAVGAINNSDGDHLYISAETARGKSGDPYDGGNLYLFPGDEIDGGAPGDLILAHNGTKKLGNVGVGTNNPNGTVQLDVAGGIKLGASSGQAPGVISYSEVTAVPGTYDFFGFNGVDWLSLTGGAGSGLWSNDGPDGPAEAYYNTGNIGIGTNNPDTQLHLSNATVGPMIRLELNDTSIIDGQLYGGIEWEGQDLSNDPASKGVRGSIKLFGDSDFGSTDMVFYTAGTNAIPLEVMRLKNGNVGIGKASPGETLEVYTSVTGKDAQITLETAGSARGKWSMSHQGEDLVFWNNSADRVVFAQSTNSQVSFGTAWNAGVDYGNNNNFKISNDSGQSLSVNTKLSLDNTTGVLTLASLSGAGDRCVHTDASGRLTATDCAVASTLPAGTASQTLRYNGTDWVANSIIYNNGSRIGIGTVTPDATKLITINGNGLVKGDWKVQSITVDTGADLAEEFVTSENLETGTVVVLGDYSLGYKSVQPSYRSYDSSVVGVVSDNPAIIMGQIDAPHKAVVALTGVVHVKVTNESGAIKRGDLLTTSSVSGYAMKAVNPQIGTIIGKALEDSNSKKGEIMALINLQ